MDASPSCHTVPMFWVPVRASGQITGCQPLLPPCEQHLGSSLEGMLTHASRYTHRRTHRQTEVLPRLRQGGVALATEQMLALGLHSSETMNIHVAVGPQSLPLGPFLLHAAHVCTYSALNSAPVKYTVLRQILGGKRQVRF